MNEYKCFWCKNCDYYEGKDERKKCINTDCILHGAEEDDENEK